MTGESSRATGGPRHLRLQELEVHVAVAVVEQAFRGEEELGVTVGARTADGVDVAEVVLAGYVAGRERERVDVVSVLESAAERCRIASAARGRVPGERVDRES